MKKAAGDQLAAFIFFIHRVIGTYNHTDLVFAQWLKLVLNHQHRIAIAKETVFILDGLFIGFHR